MTYDRFDMWRRQRIWLGAFEADLRPVAIDVTHVDAHAQLRARPPAVGSEAYPKSTTGAAALPVIAIFAVALDAPVFAEWVCGDQPIFIGDGSWLRFTPNRP